MRKANQSRKRKGNTLDLYRTALQIDQYDYHSISSASLIRVKVKENSKVERGGHSSIIKERTEGEGGVKRGEFKDLETKTQSLQVETKKGIQNIALDVGKLQGEIQSLSHDLQKIQQSFVKLEGTITKEQAALGQKLFQMEKLHNAKFQDLESSLNAVKHAPSKPVQDIAKPKEAAASIKSDSAKLLSNARTSGKTSSEATTNSKNSSSSSSSSSNTRVLRSAVSKKEGKGPITRSRFPLEGMMIQGQGEEDDSEEEGSDSSEEESSENGEGREEEDEDCDGKAFEASLNAWPQNEEKGEDHVSVDQPTPLSLLAHQPDETVLMAPLVQDIDPENEENELTLLEGMHNTLHQVIICLRSQTYTKHQELEDIVAELRDVADLEYPCEKSIFDVSTRQATILRLITCFYQTVCVVSMECGIPCEQIYGNQELLEQVTARVQGMI